MNQLEISLNGVRAKFTISGNAVIGGLDWSGRPGSNRRHSAWEADVLPLNYSRHLESTI